MRQVYHVSLVVQCILYMDGVMKVKMGDEREGSGLPGGWKRVEIDWPLVCR